MIRKLPVGDDFGPARLGADKFFRSIRRYDGPMKIGYLRKWINEGLSGKSPAYEESSHQLYRYSTLVSGAQFKEDVLESPKYVMVEFYKQQCPGCEALEPVYEKFANEVGIIQNYWKKVKAGELPYSVTEENIVNKYNLKNPEKFLDLRVTKFNT